MLSFSHVNSVTRYPVHIWLSCVSVPYPIFLSHIPFLSVSEDIMVLPFEPRHFVLDYHWHVLLLPSPTNLVRTHPIFSKLKTLHQTFSHISFLFLFLSLPFPLFFFFQIIKSFIQYIHRLKGKHNIWKRIWFHNWRRNCVQRWKVCSSFLEWKAISFK